MRERMFEATALSIGAINALVPVIVILILIAAAAGLTRGSEIFRLFGVSTLLGIRTGRGTLSGKSPFKAKARVAGGGGAGVLGGLLVKGAKSNIQSAMKQAQMNNAGNVNFQNSIGGSSAAKTFDQHVTGLASDAMAKGGKFGGPQANEMAKQVQMAVQNLENLKARHAAAAARINALKPLNPNRAAKQMDALQKEHQQEFEAAHKTLTKTLSNMINIKPPSLTPPTGISKDAQKIARNFQESLQNIADLQLRNNALNAKLSQGPNPIKKISLERKLDNSRKDLADEYKKLAAIESSAAGILSASYLSAGKSSYKEYVAKKVAVQNVFTPETISGMLDVKEFVKEHKPKK